jgi:hypothetical protein
MKRTWKRKNWNTRIWREPYQTTNLQHKKNLQQTFEAKYQKRQTLNETRCKNFFFEFENAWSQGDVEDTKFWKTNSKPWIKTFGKAYTKPQIKISTKL